MTFPTLPSMALFLILSERVRLLIVEELSRVSQPLTPVYLSVKLGIKDTSISHHLGILEKSSLVIRIPAGRNTLYNLNRPLLDALALYITSLSKGTLP